MIVFDFLGPRFPPVGHAYDRKYIVKMKEIAKNRNLELREGVYCGLGKYFVCYLYILNEINLFFRSQVDPVMKQ